MKDLMYSALQSELGTNGRCTLIDMVVSSVGGRQWRDLVIAPSMG